MDDITSWSAAQTADQIRRRAVSVEEVTRAHLEQANAANPATNALTEIIEDSLLQARQMDQQGPDEDAPLWGVPVTTKINADQAGLANSNGLPAFAGNLCKADSAVVANLKQAGAVVIGRTNTPEFSMRWCTSNPLHGVTRNPVNPALTPGGSSGAAAAAVATGVGCIAHGNDLGGSLRYPAFCCGVASIKPSTGRIPAFNPSARIDRPPATAAMSVQGPITRDVRDLPLALAAMSGRSSDDPLWSAARSSGRSRSGPLRIGYSANPFDVDIRDASVTGAMDQAVEALNDMGAVTEERPFPEADRAAELWGELLFAETDFALGPMIREHGSAEFNTLYQHYLATYPKLDLHGYLAAMMDRTRVQRAVAQMFDEVDLFMMPPSLARPFENDLDFTQPDQIPTIMQAQRPLHAINLLGLPAVAVPVGLADGAIPTGIQLVAPMHDDDFALDIAIRLAGALAGR